MILFTLAWLFCMSVWMYRETNMEGFMYGAIIILCVVVVGAEWLLGC